MKEEKTKLPLPDIDVSGSVMEKIHNKKIRMKHPLFFLAQKLGLQSVLVLVITAAALLVSILLYFLKKTNVLKFLSLGLPGLKVIFLTLPYDYIALFIITVILANYILRKLDLNQEHKFFFNAPVVTLFVIAVLIGSFFCIMGIEQITKGWSKNKIPENMAICGKIAESTDKKAVIKDEQGNLIEIFFDNEIIFPFKSDYAKNKSLCAIGWREPMQKSFHAEKIRCCDED